MSKPEQVLLIEPHSELKFQGPFNQPVSSYIKLTNPTDKKIMFKIKTTAPKRYCVRPNSGVLLPSETSQIAVCLQPFLYDPTEKNKHKFMVQSVFVPESGDSNMDTLWKEIAPEQLMDSKLKCVFDMPVDEHNQTTFAVSGEQASQRATVHTDAADAPKTSSGDGDLELQKAAKEIQRLREVESELRQEVLRLKEEKAIMKNQKVAQVANRYAPPVDAQQNYVIVAVAFVVAIVGVVVGKFVL